MDIARVVPEKLQENIISGLKSRVNGGRLEQIIHEEGEPTLVLVYPKGKTMEVSRPLGSISRWYEGVKCVCCSPV